MVKHYYKQLHTSLSLAKPQSTSCRCLNHVGGTSPAAMKHSVMCDWSDVWQVAECSTSPDSSHLAILQNVAFWFSCSHPFLITSDSKTVKVESDWVSQVSTQPVRVSHRYQHDRLESAIVLPTHPIRVSHRYWSQLQVPAQPIRVSHRYKHSQSEPAIGTNTANQSQP